MRWFLGALMLFELVYRPDHVLYISSLYVGLILILLAFNWYIHRLLRRGATITTGWFCPCV